MATESVSRAIPDMRSGIGVAAKNAEITQTPASRVTNDMYIASMHPTDAQSKELKAMGVNGIFDIQREKEIELKYQVVLNKVVPIYKQAMAQLMELSANRELQPGEKLVHKDWMLKMPGFVLVDNDPKKFLACYYEQSNVILLGVNFGSDFQLRKDIFHEMSHAYLKNSGYDPEVGRVIPGESEGQVRMAFTRVMNEAYAYSFEMLASNAAASPRDIVYGMTSKFVADKESAEGYANALRYEHDLIKSGNSEILDYVLGSRIEDHTKITVEQLQSIASILGPDIGVLLFAAKGDLKGALETINSGFKEVVNTIADMSESSLSHLQEQVLGIPEYIKGAKDSIPPRMRSYLNIK